MCHCQFARESILGAAPGSKTQCYCSLGHNLAFWEAVLDTRLTGDVICPALGGGAQCRFSITLPDAVMAQYLHDGREAAHAA